MQSCTNIVKGDVVCGCSKYGPSALPIIIEYRAARYILVQVGYGERAHRSQCRLSAVSHREMQDAGNVCTAWGLDLCRTDLEQMGCYLLVKTNGQWLARKEL